VTMESLVLGVSVMDTSLPAGRLDKSSEPHSPPLLWLGVRSAATPGFTTGRRRARAPAAWLGCLVLVAQLLVACNPASDTVQAFIQPLREQVNAVIDKAAQSGDQLLLTAAGQVDLALSNAVSALGDQLDRSIDKVDDASRANLDHLATLVADLQSGSQALVQSTIDGAQQILNTLPFTNKNPQVRAWTPHVTAAGGAGPVELTVLGNFVHATQHEAAVSLRSASAAYKPAALITSQMVFQVPAAEFLTDNGASRAVQFSLDLPVERGTIVKKTRPGQFGLLVTVVPARPVQELSVSTVVPTSRTVVQSQVVPSGASTAGGGWRVQSWSSCAPQDDQHTVAATKDWMIVPSSVQVVYIDRGFAPRGRATVTTTQPTGFQVVGHTDPNCFLGISDHSGDIEYFVTYSETRTLTEQEARTMDLMSAPYSPLGWGDSVTVPVTRHTWTVRARLWNGRTLETASEIAASAGSGNGYLSVKDDGESITVSVVPTNWLVATL
jgi:hypothetical protein